MSLIDRLLLDQTQHSDSLVERAGEEAERVLSWGRAIAYLVFASLSLIAGVQSHMRFGWLPAAMVLAFGFSAFTPVVRMLLGIELRRGQRYYAVLADMGSCFVVQYSAAWVAPQYDALWLLCSTTLAVLIIMTAGLRLDGKLLALTTLLGLALVLGYVILHPGFGRFLAIAFVLVGGGTAWLQMRSVRRAAERDAFARFLPRRVADRIARDPAGLALGGVAVEATIMFTDLRGFTRLAENRPPTEVVALLNRVHRIQVAAVFAEGGTVNKFTGDGLLAIFGAPEPLAADALAACRAARAIVDGVRALADEGVPVRVGVGLHRGTVVAGNVGSELHLEYTVIGDVVNVAARLESLTREYDADVIVSDEIARAVGQQGAIALRPLGEATVKGRAAPIAIHALDGVAMSGEASGAGEAAAGPP